MKSKISIITMFFLAIFSLSSFAPSANSISLPVVAGSTTAEAPKADKKAKMMQKLLNTKMGKWAVGKLQKRIEKRNAKLSAKLAIAEKAGDVKKVDSIKKQMKKQINFKSLGLWLLIGGVLAIIIGYIIVVASAVNVINSNGTTTSSSGFGLGSALLYLGWLAALVGIVFIIVGFVQD